MMGASQPDVTFSEQVAPAQDVQIASAVPLFIGYTQKGPLYSPSVVGRFAEYEAQFGGPSANRGMLYHAVRHYFDNRGSGAFVLSLGTYDALDACTSGELVDAFGDIRIVNALAAETSIALVAIPDMAVLPDADSTAWARAWAALLKLCHARRGVFGLLDTPDTAEAAGACVDAFLAAGVADAAPAEWAAAYWPRLVTSYDAGDGAPIAVPPSAAIAAVMESTDRHAGIWKAPANVALAQVIKPAQSWQRAGLLFNAQGVSVNLIRSFPGRGTRVWGCRTLTRDTSSPWLYVQTRRFVADVERELGRIGRHLMFEENNPITWMKLRGMVHLKLRQIWQNGGLRGDAEQDAFEIRIGLNETMSEDDIRNGKMILAVGLALARPAEFISISLTFDTRMGLSTSIDTADNRSL